MPLVSSRTESPAPLCLTRSELALQLRLDELDEGLNPILDRVLNAAQRNVESKLKRSCGAAQVVSMHKGLMHGRPEFLPDSSTASVTVEYWINNAWVTATCTLVPGVPPMLYADPTKIPSNKSDYSPNARVTATTAWVVPSDVKQAILLTAEMLFHMDQQQPINASATLQAVDMLLSPHTALTEIAP